MSLVGLPRPITVALDHGLSEVRSIATPRRFDEHFRFRWRTVLDHRRPRPVCKPVSRHETKRAARFNQEIVLVLQDASASILTRFLRNRTRRDEDGENNRSFDLAKLGSYVRLWKRLACAPLYKFSNFPLLVLGRVPRCTIILTVTQH